MAKKKVASPALVTAIIAFILAAGGWMYAVQLRADVDRASDSMLYNIIEINKRFGQLQTCYEENIKPCTEEAVKAAQ